MTKQTIDYILKEMDSQIANTVVQQKEISYIEILDLTDWKILGWKMLGNDKTQGIDISEIRELVISKLDNCISKVDGDFSYISLREYESQKLGGVKYMYIFSKERLPLIHLPNSKLIIKNKCIKLYKEYWS